MDGVFHISHHAAILGEVYRFLLRISCFFFFFLLTTNEPGGCCAVDRRYREELKVKAFVQS